MPVGPARDDHRGGDRFAGVILAGGRSRRMGGMNKSLLPLAGKPLLEHVIERVSTQVSTLALSVERHSGDFEPFGLQQLPDDQPDGGPLGGLLAAMRWMDPGCEWLLLVPCDSPFVPCDLADQLHASAVESGLEGALARYEDEIQPTFSIWHRSVHARLERAVTEEGMSGFKQFLREVHLAEKDWPSTSPSPFFNINDRAALREAGQTMNRIEDNYPCSA